MGEDPSRWDRTVYMGNLPDDIREQDIRYLLQDFGRIDDVDIKHAPHGVTYAFIEFRQARDASQAVHRRDGYDFEGEPLRVEIKDGFKGKGKGKKGKGYKSKMDRDRDDMEEFSLSVSGLPDGTMWTQLKDHMRQAGDLVYCDIYNHGKAQVRFRGYDGAKRAVEDLDGSRIEVDGQRKTIRVWWADRSERSRSRTGRG